VLGDGALLVPPGDIDALADGLARATTDDALRAQLVQRGIATAARWSWDRCAEGMAELYERAARLASPST
jgi:alpha-1,3-rhamnosyl/mannosyltransferase